MSSKELVEDILDEISNADVQILTLRKPTPIKKILDSVPKPAKAVPINGLPQWYRLSLDQKLPVPKMPTGKIVFSRGYIGEDVRRCNDESRPAFDLTDPFCRTVSYEYEPMHDPHLAYYFAQPEARSRMRQLGLATSEGRAICTLKEFNTFRKSLYNRYMDKVHNEINILDIRAREDITLTRVERDVTRRGLAFNRQERAREQMEKNALAQADEAIEKKRLAKERDAKIQARVDYMVQFKERQRRERVARGREKEQKIKQRVLAAEEMELRRKITMIRLWRKNEKKRIARLKREKEEKKRKEEEQANMTWQQRIDAQNNKIAEETLLLRLYTEDMTAGALRRERRAQVKAYNTDLELQKIRLSNWKALHGKGKTKTLLNTIATMFEKTQRGKYAISPEKAKEMAKQALADAASGAGTDRLALLGQTRYRLEEANTVPVAVTRIIEESLNTSISEFTRRRVSLLLRDVERAVYSQAVRLIDNQQEERRFSIARRKSRVQRRSIQITADLARHYAAVHRASVSFGQTSTIAAETESAIALRSVKDRPPTPVPSATELVEMIFQDRKEDLLEPVAISCNMPERRKLLDMVNTLAKILSRSVSSKVQRGLDVDTRKVTLQKGYRHSMDWSEAVDGLAGSVVEGRVSCDCADVRRGCDFLARRILLHVLTYIKTLKQEEKEMMEGKGEPAGVKDFYVPGEYSPDSTAA